MGAFRLNQVTLVGNLVADPLYDEKPGRLPRLFFRLAVSSTRKKQDGKYETDFIPCVAYGSGASTLAAALRKGYFTTVVGEIHTYEVKKTVNGAMTTLYQFEVRTKEVTYMAPADKGEVTVKTESADPQEENKEPMLHEANTDIFPEGFISPDELFDLD